MLYFALLCTFVLLLSTHACLETEPVLHVHMITPFSQICNTITESSLKMDTLKSMLSKHPPYMYTLYFILSFTFYVHMFG